MELKVPFAAFSTSSCCGVLGGWRVWGSESALTEGTKRGWSENCGVVDWWLLEGGVVRVDFTSLVVFCFRRVELGLAVDGTLAAGDGGWWLEVISGGVFCNVECRFDSVSILLDRFDKLGVLDRDLGRLRTGELGAESAGLRRPPPVLSRSTLSSSGELTIGLREPFVGEPRGELSRLSCLISSVRFLAFRFAETFFFWNSVQKKF